MKKRYILTMIFSLVALIIVAAAVTRAWFTGLNNEAVINGETQGIVFSYKITDGTTEKTDVAVYDVKGIAFFDVESDKEGKYFASMACELTLTYTNICTDNISLTLTSQLAIWPPSSVIIDILTFPPLLALITPSSLTLAILSSLLVHLTF